MRITQVRPSRRAVAAAALAAAMAASFAIGLAVGDGDAAPAADEVAGPETVIDDLAPAPEPAGDQDPDVLAGALAATGLAPPTDCPFPVGEPEFLPGAPRAYRSGVHQGLDLFCREPGHDATAVLGGRVLAATHGWQEPTAAARQAILDEAAALGATPPWTLVLLYGRHVVVDHGVVDGAGHVVTIYAHLASVDDAVQPGVEVAAGQRLGEVGSSGTSTAATGEHDPAMIHLHWEVLVDDIHLGTGLTPADTGPLYARVLGLDATRR